VRETVKRLVEGTATRSGLARVAQVGVRRRRLVLAYHNVVPRGERPWGETALHVPAARFEAHIEVLARTCSVVSLETLFSRAENRTGRPMVAITFDDAYRGAAGAARSVLARRGIPSTFFVAPALLGTEGFWWDRLAHPAGGSLAEAVRTRCLTELQGKQERVLEWAREAGRAVPAAPSHACPVDGTELHDLARSRGITVASHTWSHPNLVALSREERRDELSRSRRWLDEHLDRVRSWLAYPYGLQSDVVRADAAREGYAAGLRVEGGWISDRDPDPFGVPRLNVPAGLTADGLRLRLAGLVRA
jgi:peptidoglycan/xylan/chitin deacetylase (PgdA/CDA1 family)